MATNFDSNDRRRAANRVSSGKVSITRGSRGSRDQEEKWKKTQGRVARALIADPDLVFFWFFLASNAARGLAIELSTQLGQMIQAVEGRRLPQTEVPDAASENLEASAGRIAQVVTGAGTPSTQLLGQLQREATLFSQQYLQPNFKSGRRIQQKGSEAAATFDTARSVVLGQWSSLFPLLINLRRRRPFPESRIRSVALEVPVENLQATAEMPFPADKACAYSLQLLAGVAAVDAMSQPVDEFIRIRTSDPAFPGGLEVIELEETGGFVTKLEIRTQATQALVSPKILRVRKKDPVDWLGYSATVSSVTTAHVVLVDSTIPTGTKPLVAIKSASGVSYTQMKTALLECLNTLPTSSQMEQTLEGLDHESSAAKTRDMAVFLGQTAQCLHPLDSEALNALDRMGAEVDTSITPLSELLLDYAPPAAEDTKAAARAALDSLRSDGFTLAERYLLDGSISEFFIANVAGASFGGKFGQAAAEFSDGFPRDAPPVVGGR